jgi:hypothetical protein
MNKSASPPTPAIVTQEAVRTMPRWALVLLCMAYVLAGFLGREPWKGADIASFGVMLELASGQTPWLAPQLYGQSLPLQGLLPYWMGAWAIQIAPSWLSAEVASRVPFALMLALTLIATWYGTYYLARLPAAQPVPFAFGGEANPVDYGRSMADGALLALIAMLGLAQLSHEATPSVAQLGFSALLFYAVAASWIRIWQPAVALVVASFGLALSGAPAFGLAMACAGAAARLLGKLRLMQSHSEEPWHNAPRAAWLWATLILGAGVVAALLAHALGQWHAGMGSLPTRLSDWKRLSQLWVWFTWPAWPLALLALWRWRKWLLSLHIAWPLAAMLVMVIATILRPGADRTLLLALPALACLAAMALPTLHRSVAALVDWFTLLFFTACSVVIWVVYASIHTGWPAKPAQNVARLLPGFESQFSLFTLLIALLATAAWVWVLIWRVGRHRSALWKSLVLPATGTAVSWVLLATLWMPILNQGRSYMPTMARITAYLQTQNYSNKDCIAHVRLTASQQVALRVYARLPLQDAPNDCRWMLADGEAVRGFDLPHWQRLQAFRRRGSNDVETMVLFRRVDPSASQ